MTDTVKIAVCDDEKNIRSYLVSLIRRQDIECSITEYTSVDGYLADGREHDLVFLDIEMGSSGTEMDEQKFAEVFSRAVLPHPPGIPDQLFPCGGIR